MPAFAVLVAACDGGDETPDSATVTLTKTEASKEQLEEAVAEVLIQSLNQQAEETAALGAPEDDENEIEAIVVPLEEIEDDPNLVFEERRWRTRIGRPTPTASRSAARNKLSPFRIFASG